MAWIKRNLLFVIGAAVAVGLLAIAGFYDYQNWQRNKTALDQLNQAYDTLRTLNSKTPSPGNDKIDNIQTAKEQEAQLQAWIQRAGQYFKPVPPVPNPSNGPITDAQFASARDHTLSKLQAEAADASVALPAQYGFSFEAERTLVKFSPAGLAPLAQELGEVKALCEALYSAKVNSLDDVRRVPVSADDAGGPPQDYLSATIVTNNLAVFTPYELTFRCFSQNLAQVLTKLALSPHGFIVKAINVQPAASVASESAGGVQGMGQPPGYPAPGYNPGYAPPGNPGYPQRMYNQQSFTPMPAPTRNGGLQTVLNEQLLSITMDVEIVKLMPGN